MRRPSVRAGPGLSRLRTAYVPAPRVRSAHMISASRADVLHGNVDKPGRNSITGGSDGVRGFSAAGKGSGRDVPGGPPCPVTSIKSGTIAASHEENPT